jgi:hypothetical protein
MSVCPSICPHAKFENDQTDLHKIWCWGMLLKFIDKFQVWLKSENNNNGYFTWRPACVSAHGSDWVGDLQATMVTMVTHFTVVTWGIRAWWIPNQPCNDVSESSLMTSSTKQRSARHAVHSNVIGFRQLWGHLVPFAWVKQKKFLQPWLNCYVVRTFPNLLLLQTCAYLR